MMNKKLTTIFSVFIFLMLSLNLVSAVDIRTIYDSTFTEQGFQFQPGMMGEFVGQGISEFVSILAAVFNGTWLNNMDQVVGFLRFLNWILIFSLIFYVSGKLPLFDNKDSFDEEGHGKSVRIVLAIVFATISVIFMPAAWLYAQGGAFAGTFYTLIIFGLLAFVLWIHKQLVGEKDQETTCFNLFLALLAAIFAIPIWWSGVKSAFTIITVWMIPPAFIANLVMIIGFVFFGWLFIHDLNKMGKQECFKFGSWGHGGGNTGGEGNENGGGDDNNGGKGKGDKGDKGDPGEIPEELKKEIKDIFSMIMTLQNNTKEIENEINNLKKILSGDMDLISGNIDNLKGIIKKFQESTEEEIKNLKSLIKNIEKCNNIDKILELIEKNKIELSHLMTSYFGELEKILNANSSNLTIKEIGDMIQGSLKEFAQQYGLNNLTSRLNSLESKIQGILQEINNMKTNGDVSEKEIKNYIDSKIKEIKEEIKNACNEKEVIENIKTKIITNITKVTNMDFSSSLDKEIAGKVDYLIAKLDELEKAEETEEEHKKYESKLIDQIIYNISQNLHILFGSEVGKKTMNGGLFKYMKDLRKRFRGMVGKIKDRIKERKKYKKEQEMDKQIQKNIKELEQTSLDSIRIMINMNKNSKKVGKKLEEVKEKYFFPQEDKNVKLITHESSSENLPMAYSKSYENTEKGRDIKGIKRSRNDFRGTLTDMRKILKNYKFLITALESRDVGQIKKVLFKYMKNSSEKKGIETALRNVTKDKELIKRFEDAANKIINIGATADETLSLSRILLPLLKKEMEDRLINKFKELTKKYKEIQKDAKKEFRTTNDDIKLLDQYKEMCTNLMNYSEEMEKRLKNWNELENAKKQQGGTELRKAANYE